MKLALIGHGKMGHAVERIALSRGHEIVSIIDAGETDKFDTDAFRSADVVIEFTTPATAVDNYRRVIAAGIPLVSGTTGWLDRLPEVEQMLADAPQGMFWTANFSVGVALFKKIVAEAARLISSFADYRPSLDEIHHIHKLDHPSGTAVATAETLIEATPALTGWTEDPAQAAADPSRLLITHQRIGEVPGTHTVTWQSPVDEISLTHRAYSREGFALGAVLAAEWMTARHPRGLHSMDDLLPLN